MNLIKKKHLAKLSVVDYVFQGDIWEIFLFQAKS
jgi:hypothetical protein